ncbi:MULTISPECIES: hypothetical protein [unclassified Streptomyces]|uniref:hypothetical protein n=1 Tax=unclassified Streptomyces TaxID=2593676 RepID=UPI00380A333C
MGAQRRSVIRSAVVATGALAVLLLPSGAAFAASTVPTDDRTSIMLPDNGLAGLAERAGHLPTVALVGGMVVLAAVGAGLMVRRRRQEQAGHQGPTGHEGRRHRGYVAATAPAAHSAQVAESR